MATIATYAKFQPLYEAMTVCSMAVQHIKKEEADRADSEMLQCAMETVQKVREFVSLVRGQKDIFADSDPAEIGNIVGCMGILNAMQSYLTRKTREMLPTISEKYQQAFVATLDDSDRAIEQVNDILESWAISTDTELSARITESLKEIDPGKADVGEWRKALETVSD